MLGIIHELLLIGMIVTAVIIVLETKTIRAVLELALFSLLFVIVLFLLKAPDVALSAIVVGAMILGLLLYTVQEVEGLRNVFSR